VYQKWNIDYLLLSFLLHMLLEDYYKINVHEEVLVPSCYPAIEPPPGTNDKLQTTNCYKTTTETQPIQYDRIS
jgi:hypothetical protein